VVVVEVKHTSGRVASKCCASTADEVEDVEGNKATAAVKDILRRFDSLLGKSRVVGV
jgi:hypothetical protein